MRCDLIAEIGWNHMGDMSLAKEMIAAAAEAGADYAKFQTWSVKFLTKGDWDDDGRLDIYRKAELTADNHHDLFQYCKSKGISFLTSVFNATHFALVDDLGMDKVKVPSHEVYNTELLKQAAARFGHVFVSTGAANWDEVKKIPSAMGDAGFTLMQCTSAYPVEALDINLPRINALRDLSHNVGYSGHFFGIEDAVLALSYGVSVIEKHFTIDKSLPGRDNKFALDADEFTQLTKFRDASAAMNTDRGCEMLKCELPIYNNYRGRWSAAEERE